MRDKLPKISKMKAVNEQFHARIIPEFYSWGLSQHPNPSSCFGRNDHGYHYDFADIGDRQDIKLASFAIIQPNASLWIKAYKAGKVDGDLRSLMILFDNIKGIYTLTKKWSILRPLDSRFELEKKNSEDASTQAEHLIDDVLQNIGKLKGYLYG